PALEKTEVQKEELQEPEVDVKPFFLSRAVLTGLADAKWTGEHDAILEHFAQDPSEPILTIFIDPCLGLKLDLGMPVQVGTPLSQTPRWPSRELRVLHISIIFDSYLLCPRSVEPHSVSDTLLGSRIQTGMRQGFAFDDLMV
ncbi:PREDICTED: dynein heavy chain 2, axonemal-like, partial [Hipposideros armiger]|uniref:Dynein heavy chain 2, axonemal-like n=1 Tax=Hipposideros armiger TaxID=186990 RepID=A0A8B7QPD9_HIPAR